MIKVYTYKKCGSCRKATQWLDSKGIAYDEQAIRETPPTRRELQTMLNAYEGDLRKLFNTSGMDYRALNLKETLPGMGKSEAFQLLSENGNLVKRPFLLSDSFNAVGFKEAVWSDALS